MTLTRTCRIFEYQVPRGHFPHVEVLKYINTCNSETSKQEIRRQFHYRDLLIFKLACLGEILKADWNVLGAHSKLFYLYNPSIESIFKPLLRQKILLFQLPLLFF